MLEDLIHDRERKLENYTHTSDPFPARVLRTEIIKSFVDKFTSFEKSKKRVIITGRIFSWRDQGKIIFANVRDESGAVQIVLNEKEMRSEFTLPKETFDIGDFVEVKGVAFKTKRGEKSVLVKKIRIIAKGLRPIPSEWFGIEDVETRLRKRYLDLLMSSEVRGLFKKKSLFWDAVRSFLKQENFLEVETPVLESIPGGAEAEPFVTHHNALDSDFYLRISLELPLKKLLVGGFEKVFEIGRVFRNEGIDKEHLQDYIQMECYWAYADYRAMMKFVEKMYKTVIRKAFGTLSFDFQEKKINWGKKWKIIDYFTIFKKETGIDLSSVTKIDLEKKAKLLGISLDGSLGKGRLIDLIYKKSVRPKLIEPCFLINPPVEIEPLAKRMEGDKNRVERFQVMAYGTELGKGFSELNNPIDQRGRFEDQMKLREAGDKEAQMIDESFLEALEYGMPPAGGFGMSERVFSVLAGLPIRETVFFPLMREGEK